jgi:hypothetical protein
VWASRLIQEIRLSKPSNDINQPSLRDHLNNFNIKDKKYIFDDETRKEVLSMYT